MSSPRVLRSARVLRLITFAVSTLCTASVLSACAPLIIGGIAGGTALVATDRRTTGTQVEDTNIALKAQNQMRKQLGDTARIDATVYMSRVLLTGEVPDQASKNRATELAAQVENVKDVINQLRIAPLASHSAIAHDTWISSKVRTALINTRGVPSRTITVTTDDSVVYLMGKVTRTEGDMAAAAAADVGGVKQVVKVFNIMTPAEQAALAGTTQATRAASNPPVPAPITTLPTNPGGAQTAVEVIPVE